MYLTNEECLKKAILDTQEKVRDFEQYSKEVKDNEISACFKKFAEQEGHQAAELLQLLKTKTENQQE